MSIPAMLNTGWELFSGVVGMNHRFAVKIDPSQFDLGSWASASGLSVRWNVAEYKSGDKPNYSWILPGTTKYENIKLRRAACSDSATVQQWLASTSKDPAPLSGSVQLLDWLGFAVVEWRLKEFFPIGWSITEFDASAAKPALETLELAHTGFLFDDQQLL
ncbi:MAG TPA: phage tail protein [Pseudonocardiaceae bacterium]|nr:phage tail protein [Pseudonocardiaceae bacterium]